MGGVAKTTMKAVNTFKNDATTALKHPSKLNIGQIANLGAGGALSPVQQAFDSFSPKHGPGIPEQNISPEELAAQRDALEAEGQRQFDQTNQFINQDQASRQIARGKLADALNTQGQAFFQQGLPKTLEDLNSRGLLNGSGVGQEIARQQGQLATNIANQSNVQGTNDLDLASQQRAAALDNQQSYQGQGIARTFGLQDYVRQANLSRALAMQSSGNGKGGIVSGAGTGAAAGSSFGPWGALAGAAGGAYLGAQSGR